MAPDKEKKPSSQKLPVSKLQTSTENPLKKHLNSQRGITGNSSRNTGVEQNNISKLKQEHRDLAKEFKALDSKLAKVFEQQALQIEDISASLKANDTRRPEDVEKTLSSLTSKKDYQPLIEKRQQISKKSKSIFDELKRYGTEMKYEDGGRIKKLKLLEDELPTGTV